MAQRPSSRPTGGDSSRGNWRNPGRKAAPVKRETPLYGRNEASHSGLWWRRVLSLLLVFVLVLVFIAVIRWIPRSTPLVVLTVTDYAAPAPPNSWAQEDAAALSASWAPKGNWQDYWSNVRVVMPEESKPTPATFIETAIKLLNEHPAGGPQKNVRVLYLSAHGIVNAANEPCLLLANAREDQATQIWPTGAGDLPLVSLPELISQLRESAKQAAGAKYVLLLDANRIDSNWRLGVLENDFATRLAEYMNSTTPAGDNSVVIINSVSPGEIAQAYPEYGASGFGMFARAGLLGAADADQDRKVELHELHEYLLKRVDVLAQQGRYRTQQPQLLPTQVADFAVAYAQDRDVDPLTATAGVTAEALQERWKSTFALWQKHTQLAHYHDDGAVATDLPGMHLPSLTALEQGLLRLDQLVDAGGAYSDDFQTLEAALQRLAGQLLTEAQAQAAQPRTLSAAPSASDSTSGAPAPKIEEFEWLRAMLAGGDAAKPALEKWQALPLERQQYFVFHWLASEPEPSFDNGLAWLTASATPMMLATEPAGIRSLRRFRAEGALPGSIREQRSLLQKVLLQRYTTDLFAQGGGDLRAQYVAIPYVVAADAARRGGEDRLFTGDIAGVESALSNATTSYQGDIHDSRNIASWYELRDTMWQELSHYAEWTLTLQRETSGQRTGQTEANELVERVRRGIELNARMTQALEWLTEAARGESPSADIAAITKQVNELGGALLGERLALRGAFQAAVNRCNNDAAGDRVSLTEVVRVLRVPLSGYNREALRMRYLQILTKQRALSLDEDSDDKQATSTTSDMIQPANLTALAKQGQHPGALLWQVAQRFPVAISGLKLTDLTTTIAADDSQTYITRLELAKVADQVQQIRDTETAAPRHTLSSADQKTRVGLPFFTLPPTYNEPELALARPQQKLYDCDLHHNLVFQAERTLDDFWGALDAPAAASSLGDYFALVAESYLQKASGLYSNQSEPLRAAQQKLTLRKTAAQQLLNEIARANIAGKPIEGTNTFERTIHWPEGDHKGRVNGLPAGLAALYTLTNNGDRGNILLRTSKDGKFLPVLPQTIFSSADSDTVLPAKLEFELGENVVADSSIDLVFYYRSHGERQLVNVGQLVPGPVTVWTRPQNVAPTVVVQNPTTDAKLGSVALLLDCSHSMEDPFAGKDSRMKVALRALRELTEELEKNGQKDFTIWLFGHRRYAPTKTELGTKQYFDVDTKTIKSRFNPVFGPDDPSIHYHNDVQQVWPTETGTSLKSLLDPESPYILPYGRTPLYAAMYQAIVKDLATRDRSAPRRLIVLSDGNNYVRQEKVEAGVNYDPKWNYNSAEDKTARDVIEALESDSRKNSQERIDLHIVDLTNGSATAIKDDNVVEKAQGTFHLAGNLAELKRILREASGLYKYSVHDSRQRYVAEGVPLGQRTEINNYIGQTFSALLEGRPNNNSSPFRVSGGEELVYNIQYAAGQPQLIPWRGNIEKAESQTVVNPAHVAGDEDFSPARFQTILAVPQRSGGSDVKFRIAIVNQLAERFSPRPKSAWVEIEPGNTVDGAWMPSAEKYIFADLTLELGQPVPVLQQEARAWPRTAKEARVQVWFSLQDWPSSIDRKLRTLRVSSADEEENFEIKDPNLPPGLRCAVQFAPRPEGGTHVIVTQTSDAAVPPALRIKMSRQPDAIRRQYYRAPHAGRVRHVFEYRNVAQDELLEDFLEFQTLEQLKPIAAHLEGPVVIRVPDK